MNPTEQFLKRLESRVALALSRAEGAFLGILSLSNHIAVSNAAPIGPAGQVIFTTPAFLSRTGKTRIWMYAGIAPGTAVAGDSVAVVMFRDGAQLPGAPEMLTAMIAPDIAIASLVWDDSVVAGSSHTYAIASNIANGSGHTIEYGIGGGSFGGNAAIVLQELPG